MDFLEETDSETNIRKTSRSQISVSSEPSLALHRSSGQKSTAESEDSAKESVTLNTSFSVTSLHGEPATSSQESTCLHQREHSPVSRTHLVTEDVLDGLQELQRESVIKNICRSPVGHLGQTSAVELKNSNRMSVIQYVSSDNLVFQQGKSPSFSEDVVRPHIPHAFTSEGSSSSGVHCPALQDISDQSSTEMLGHSDKNLTGSEVYSSDHEFSNSMDTLKMENSLSQPSFSGNIAGLHVLDSPAECTEISLLNRDLWRTLNEHNHEMQVSVFGSKMIPSIRVKVCGLRMDKRYSVYLEFLPQDLSIRKYIVGKWTTTGTVEHLDVVRVDHPDSPNHGRVWVASEGEIEFKEVRFTNNPFAGKHTKLVYLRAFIAYQPRVNVVEVNDSGEPKKGSLVMFSCPEMTFITVTSYQCRKMRELKLSLQNYARVQ